MRRELMEELDLRVQVGQALNPMTHAYAAFTVILYPFICAVASGKIFLHEHEAFAWLSPAGLLTLDWAEADRPVLGAYLETLGVRESKTASS